LLLLLAADPPAHHLAAVGGGAPPGARPRLPPGPGAQARRPAERRPGRLPLPAGAGGRGGRHDPPGGPGGRSPGPGDAAGAPRPRRPITWRRAAAARRPVLARGYRQGPVPKLADSLSGALDAYHCLLERGYEPEDMIVAGDSAGGHLTLATLLALRDRGLGLP